MKHSATLGEVSIPVIDIYGDADSNAVSTAAARLGAYNTGAGLDYTQTAIPCIAGLNCHQLQGQKGDDSMPLEVSVNAWMQAVAPASQIPGCTVVSPTPAPTPPPASADTSGSLNIFLMALFATLLSALRVLRFK
jgi:hypothetical protein